MSETPFADRVRHELARARERHAPIHTAHEGYAVILEEVEEFWLEVMRKFELRSPGAMARELVQIAATAQRVAEDLALPGLEGS